MASIPVEEQEAVKAAEPGETPPPSWRTISRWVGVLVLVSLTGVITYLVGVRQGTALPPNPIVQLLAPQSNSSEQVLYVQGDQVLMVARADLVVYGLQLNTQLADAVKSYCTVDLKGNAPKSYDNFKGAVRAPGLYQAAQNARAAYSSARVQYAATLSALGQQVKPPPSFDEVVAAITSCGTDEE